MVSERRSEHRFRKVGLIIQFWVWWVIATIFGAVPLALSIAILACQLLFYLQHDLWISIPAIAAFVDPSAIDATLFFPNETAMAKFAAIESPWLPALVLDRSPYQYFGDLSKWLAEPRAWIGLHKVVLNMLKTAPLSLAFFLVTLLVAPLAIGFSLNAQDELQRRDEEEEDKKTGKRNWSSHFWGDRTDS